MRGTQVPRYNANTKLQIGKKSLHHNLPLLLQLSLKHTKFTGTKSFYQFFSTCKTFVNKQIKNKIYKLILQNPYCNFFYGKSGTMFSAKHFLNQLKIMTSEYVARQ